MTSMVFQSGTEKRARFPSKVMTPEKTWWTILLAFYDIVWHWRLRAYIAADITTEESDGERIDSRRFVGMIYSRTIISKSSPKFNNAP